MIITNELATAAISREVGKTVLVSWPGGWRTGNLSIVGGYWQIDGIRFSPNDVNYVDMRDSENIKQIVLKKR